MSDLGIPIPPKQSPYYCGKCGGHHPPNPVEVPATAADMEVLRGAINALVDRIAALEAKRKK